MKKFAFTLISSLLCLCTYSQSIQLVKNKFVQSTPTDSMFYIRNVGDYVPKTKLVAFKDSGVVVIAYGDSVIENTLYRFRINITAFDKELNALWSTRLPFSGTTSYLSADMDENYRLTLTCYSGAHFSLIKIGSDGKILLNKAIDDLISPNIPVITGMANYQGNHLIYGNIYNTGTSYYPFIALFDSTGMLLKKKVLPLSIASLQTSLVFKYSMLNITQEKNISVVYQNDTLNNYTIACYDSALNYIWSKPFSVPISSVHNLFNQGSNIVFLNISAIGSTTTILKYDSKTGVETANVNRQFIFHSPPNKLVLPTKNANFLVLGDSNFSSGGVDLGMSYLNDNAELAFLNATPVGSENNLLSDACIIGNHIYTASVHAVNKYSYPTQSFGKRGFLRINKYTADFLNATTSIANVQDEINEVLFYPNPFTNQVSISPNGLNQSYKIEIYDQLGHSITANYSKVSDDIIIELNQMNAGMYTICLTDKNGIQIKCSKMVKD